MIFQMSTIYWLKCVETGIKKIEAMNIVNMIQFVALVAPITLPFCIKTHFVNVHSCFKIPT